MDACEIANFLAKEFMTYQQFITLDGLSSGVPTQTTPTLTPTTLKSIEQTFIELQNSEPEGHQAGFVPPVVIGNNQYITSSSVTSDTEVSSKSGSSMWGSDSSIRPTPPVTPHNDIIQTTTSTRRNTGGRRPTKNLNISPEEEERRNVRRERNKMAAARCRKRRLDHTNALLQETDGLEQKKQALQTEIQQLQEERDELQFILESHRAVCRIHMVMAGRSVSPPDIKPFVFASLDSDDVKVKTEFIDSDISLGADLLSPTGKKILLTSVTAANTLNSLNTMHPLPNKPSRPSTLNVPGAFVPSSNSLKSSSMADIAGIPITTPSAGIPFNFESLMEGGTGLTPVSGPLVPSCASQSQHRNGMSPNNGDLVTPDPTCTSKLVSL